MSVLTPSQTTITWKGLSAEVKDKIILDNCDGYAKPGEVLAIMGPSGAGKTTLLSLLTGRHPDGIKVTGQARANGEPYNAKEFYSFGNFVFQNDILFESMTVKQSIEFSASLRLSGNQEYKSRKVDELIQDLQLLKCQNTPIGGKFVQGVSGGERKRTCIALQVITNPSLLVLDEPTSGLDSHTACILLEILLKMAKKGRTIILTIHQPSSKLYNMLDRLILLHKGETIYQGKADQIVTYMNGLKIFIPLNFSVSDFFMFEISQYKTKIQGKQSNLNAHNYNISLRQKIRSSIGEMENNFQEIGFPEKQPICGFFEQMRIIMHRALTDILRHPMKIKTQIGGIVVSLIMVGCIFFMSASKQPEAGASFSDFISYLFNLQGVSFTAIVNMTMQNLFGAVMTFVSEKEIYLKEVSSKYYTPLAYYLSRNIVELPFGILFPFITSTCLYFMLGYAKTFQQYAVFAFTLVVVALAARGLGVMMGTIFQTPKQATAMAGLILLPLMMFGGLYSRFNQFPAYIGWLQYISPFKYGFQSVIYNQLEGEVWLARNGAGMIIPFEPLTELAIDTPSFVSIGILAGIAGGFYVAAFVFLRIFSSKINA